MTASYLPASNSKAELRSLAAGTDKAAAGFVTGARKKVAVVLVGVGLVATVAWIGVLGWTIGALLRLW
jgi:hypothetical protein